MARLHPFWGCSHQGEPVAAERLSADALCHHTGAAVSTVSRADSELHGRPVLTTIVLHRQARLAVGRQHWSCQQETLSPVLTKCLIQQSWYCEPQASLSPQYTQTAAEGCTLCFLQELRAYLFTQHTAHWYIAMLDQAATGWPWLHGESYWHAADTACCHSSRLTPHGGSCRHAAHTACLHSSMLKQQHAYTAACLQLPPCQPGLRDHIMTPVCRQIF